jgi:hypothetical protein
MLVAAYKILSEPKISHFRSPPNATPHVLVDLPPGHGSSVTDFWVWDPRGPQLRFQKCTTSTFTSKNWGKRRQCFGWDLALAKIQVRHVTTWPGLLFYFRVTLLLIFRFAFLYRSPWMSSLWCYHEDTRMATESVTNQPEITKGIRIVQNW